MVVCYFVTFSGNNKVKIRVTFQATELPNNRRFVLQVLLFPINIKIEFRVISKQLRMVGNVCYAVG